MSERLHPTLYTGELLCICCGAGKDSGERYMICTNRSVTHEESCATYNYDEDELCDECERRDER